MQRKCDERGAPTRQRPASDDAMEIESDDDIPPPKYQFWLSL